LTPLPSLPLLLPSLEKLQNASLRRIQFGDAEANQHCDGEVRQADDRVARMLVVRRRRDSFILERKCSDEKCLESEALMLRLCRRCDDV